MPRHTIQDGLQALSDSIARLNQADTLGDPIKAFPTILAMARLAAKGDRGPETSPTPRPNQAIARMGDILTNPHKPVYSAEKKLLRHLLATVGDILKPTPIKTEPSPRPAASQPFSRKPETPVVEPSPRKPKPK
ncbi:MAG: hypothetical protein U1E78_03660 [Gammaproteobacteria bacterium]